MFGDLYRANRQRVLKIMDGRDTEVTVPACPDWTALDVVRHLTGLASDVVALDVDGYATEAWTDHQVASRQGQSLEALTDEWSTSSQGLAAMLDDLDSSGLPEFIRTSTGLEKRQNFSAAIIGDLIHHEFDLRNAYGDRADRDRPDVVLFGIGHAKALRPVFNHLGLPTLRIEIEGSGEHVDVGRDEPAASLSLTPFEALRGIGGRRTRTELEGLAWAGDSEQFLDHIVLPSMSPAGHSLAER